MNYKSLFSQFSVSETITLPKNMPDIEQILSIIGEPYIISTKIIDTMKGKSIEGQKLTGKKAVIELCIKQKVLYSACVKDQSLHIIESEIFHSTYVVIPMFVEGTDPKILLEKNFIIPVIKIEDILWEKLDKRTIYKSVFLLAKIHFNPTFELCYSSSHNCTNSNICMAYKDGTNNKQITFCNDKKNIQPKWSPFGQDIAYLSNRTGKYMIYKYNIITHEEVMVTSPCTFGSVSDYCWNDDGQKIVFSSYIGGEKELFQIDTSTKLWKKLTYGDRIIKSYKPKCSPDGKKIGFIRCTAGITSLWIMTAEGLNIRKIAPYPYVKDFDWLYDSNSIVFIYEDHGKCDKVLSVNIKDDTVNELLIDKPFTKTKIKASPDGNLIAFIGTEQDIDDIYIFNIKCGNTENVTKNNSYITIKNFTWSCDSSEIFYCAKNIGYYNIYSVSVENNVKRQITLSKADNMNLSYRPRIK